MTENKMFYCTGEVVNGKQIFVLKRHSTPNLGKEITKQVRFEMTERVRSNSEHLESGNTLLPIEEFTTKIIKNSPKRQLIKSAQLISIYLLLGTVGIGVEILCNYYAVMDCYEHTPRQYLYQLLAFVSASLSIISALASYVALLKAWRKLFKSIRGVNEMRKTLTKELASENPDRKQLKRKFLNNLRHLLIQSILIIAATCLVAYLGHHQQIKYAFLCSQLAYKVTCSVVLLNSFFAKLSLFFCFISFYVGLGTFLLFWCNGRKLFQKKKIEKNRVNSIL
ncbi:hypothetical protein M3Y97_01149200 [Aphelenchoides bicaudatus]|nr:hypothetical protein M3Y97_01149200 [Aphelenchoides bicaudatus]